MVGAAVRRAVVYTGLGPPLTSSLLVLADFMTRRDAVLLPGQLLHALLGGAVLAYVLGSPAALLTGQLTLLLPASRVAQLAGAAVLGAAATAATILVVIQHAGFALAVGLAGALPATCCAAAVLALERKSPAPKSGADLA